MSADVSALRNSHQCYKLARVPPVPWASRIRVGDRCTPRFSQPPGFSPLRAEPRGRRGPRAGRGRPPPADARGRRVAAAGAGAVRGREPGERARDVPCLALSEAFPLDRVLEKRGETRSRYCDRWASSHLYLRNSKAVVVKHLLILTYFLIP